MNSFQKKKKNISYISNIYIFSSLLFILTEKVFSDKNVAYNLNFVRLTLMEIAKYKYFMLINFIISIIFI